MAVYRVQGPDGKIHRFEGPDGASPAQIEEFAAEQFSKPKEEPKTTRAPSWMASIPGRALMGVVDAVDGGAQMLSRLGGPEEASRVDAMVKERNQIYDSARQGAGQSGFDLPRTIGNVGASALLTRGMGTAATLGGKVAQGAAAGGALGALQPVTQGHFGDEKAKQIGVGAITGGAAAPVAHGLGKLVTPKTSAATKTLMDEGVTPMPGQVLGGAFKSAEEKAMSWPIIGGMIKSANERSVQQFNNAAINRSIAPIGMKLPKGTTGHEAIEFAETQLGKVYDDAIAKMGAVQGDDAIVRELQSLAGNMQNMPKEKAEQFVRIVRNEIAERFTPEGYITGEGIKAAESNLGRMAKGYKGNQDFDTRMLGDALEEAQASLRRFVERNAPKEAAEQLQKANTGWAAFKRVQRAAASVGSDEGVFTPAQLQSSVKALDRSKDKGSFARGDALMQDLSKAGKSVMSPRVPNSGTADRLMGPGLIASLAAGSSVLPYAAAGIPLAAMYTRPGMYLASQAAAGIPGLLNNSGPALTAAALPLTYGLLNQ
jgi:hypothetical protein